MHVPSRRSRIVVALATAGLVVVGLFTANLAFASHPEVSLTGSNFEIDTDANLKVDDATPSIDWGNVTEIRKADSPSGNGDESFGNGTKEDSAVPSVVDGSIPPNKSDLKYFGVFQEGGSSTGFLNLYWSRVQDPQGTTNMDFEFNKNKCGGTGSVCSANGVTPVRSAGDLLITYDLSNGGSNPTLSLRTWSGSAWGTSVSLTASGKATGSINTDPIAEADSDGLGAHSLRTFGEAQIKLSEVLPSNTCTTFGSAYLKSRSSDSFTAAVKDFVPPAAVNITNCGSVKIVKTGGGTDPLNGAELTLYKDLGTSAQQAPTQTSHGAEDTATTLKCTTAGTGADAGTCTIANVPFGKYWLVETVVPAGYVQAPDQAVNVVDATLVTKTFDDPVAIIPTTMNTQQRWLPNHQAVVSVAAGQGNLAGPVTFTMHESNDCSGADIYAVTRNVVTDDLDGTAGGLTTTVRTANTKIYTASQNISWEVEFNSTNIHHADSLNSCDKSSWTLGNNFSG
jgi:hypothetical protein